MGRIRDLSTRENRVKTYDECDMYKYVRYRNLYGSIIISIPVFIKCRVLKN